MTGDTIFNFCRLQQKIAFWSVNYTPAMLHSWWHYKTLRNIHFCSYLQCIAFCLHFQSSPDCSVELLLVITTMYDFRDSVPVRKMYGCYYVTQKFQTTFHFYLSDTRRLQCVDVNNPIRTVFYVFMLYIFIQIVW